MKLIKRQALIDESKKVLSVSLWKRRLLFWGGGISVGLICVLFAWICDLLNKKVSAFFMAYPYSSLVITPLMFVVIIFLIRNVFSGVQGSGIPQVMLALEIKNMTVRRKLVSWKIALGKFSLTLLAFMSGASIGREGPTIQLSASIMQALGRWGKFHRHDLERGLLLAGGAAGIAAAFNTPLAGIVFAIEELSGSFERGVSGTIITTVVLSGIVAQYLLGNYTYFGSSVASLDFITGWLPFLIVTILCGFLGGCFSKLLCMLSGLTGTKFKHFPYRVAIILGLLVAIIGVLSGGLTFGSGYGIAKDLLMGNSQGGFYDFAYGPLKFLSILCSYLSGISGGLFAPSLSCGAGFGEILSYFFQPHFKQAIILLATVAYFSGVVQSPITCFVIVLEMTNSTNTNMVLPIMLSSLMATGISKLICREPLYHALAKRYYYLIKA
jgi:H+/Cl- antiporter ClcA